MKKFIVGTLLILFAINVQAQWYTLKYGVSDINELSEEQMSKALQQAKNNVKTGKILTYTGLGLGVIGTVVGVHATSKIISPPYNRFEEDMNEFAAGGWLMLGGMGAMAVGIPLWAVNASRRNKIEVALIKFNSSSYLGLYQPTYFGYKQPSSFGLSIKINF